jgi:TPR repeat protein
MPDKPPPDVMAKAQAGDAEAQSALGRWYVEHAGDAVTASEWFRRAADQGLPRAKHNLGVIAHQQGDLELAAQWFGSAAQDGWVNSMLALGGLAEGAGQADLAAKYYEMAAARGDVEGQDALGRLAFERDSDEHHATALYWSELAAKQGHAGAITRLGTIYHEGRGVSQNVDLAAAWYLKAAQLGHPGAQLCIGAAYHLGVGVESDRVESAFWLCLSIAQGNDLARAYLQRVQRELTEEEKAAVASRLRDHARA